MATYAKDRDQVRNYLASNYGIDFVVKPSFKERIHLNGGYVAEFDNNDCQCGGADGCFIYDAEKAIVEDIIICDTCYENNPDERL